MMTTRLSMAEAAARWLLLASILAASVAPGCDVPQPASLTGAQLRPLHRLRDGQTTRADALLLLGTPSAVFDDGRVLTYRIRTDGKGRAIPAPRRGV